MDLKIKKYHPAKSYNRNGTDCILCAIRNKLIKKTPEEIIRQAFVQYLIKERNVPLDKIKLEYPLTRFNKGDRKRADIIIYGDEDNSNIILIVEC